MAYKPDSVPRGFPRASMTIPLHLLLPTGSSCLPGSLGAKPPAASGARSLCGIAPGGACRAGPVARPAVRSYRTVSPLPPKGGGLFSVALSLGSPRPGVTRHRCLVESGLSSTPGSSPETAVIQPSARWLLTLLVVTGQRESGRPDRTQGPYLWRPKAPIRRA